MDRTTQTPTESWLPPVPPGTSLFQPATDPPAGAPPAPPTPAPPARPPQRSGLQRLFGPVLVIGAFLLKFGKGAFLLIKGAKFATTSISMLVSVAAYALIWGWKFAAGFVALLFIHEMGHYIQLRREGIRPSAMVFIPFLGAAVSAKSLGGNALAEARVGLAGPVIGSLAAAALIPVAATTGNDFWNALAFTGLFLNLFNLVPVVPFDGGRAMAALSPWMWFVGLGALAVFAFTFPNPIIFLILLLGAFETYRRWKGRRAGEEGNTDYYRVAPRHRAMVFGVYLLLIAGCVIGMDASFVDRSDHF